MAGNRWGEGHTERLRLVKRSWEAHVVPISFRHGPVVYVSNK
jgi:hypothetical protein